MVGMLNLTTSRVMVQSDSGALEMQVGDGPLDHARDDDIENLRTLIREAIAADVSVLTESLFGGDEVHLSRDGWWVGQPGE